MVDNILANPPIPHNEVERLRALFSYSIMDSLDEAEFDRITEIASIICDVPISLVSLLDENRQWFKSNFGLNVKETPRDLAFCQYAIMDTKFFEVKNAMEDERFRRNDLVTGDPNIRFYAGIPLVDADNYVLGTLCVIDRVPTTLSAKQNRALHLLAQEVMALISERRKKAELKNFEKLFALSNDLVFVGGSDGYFQQINPSFQRIFGWSKEHLLSTPHFEFLHPDDIKASKDQLTNLEKGEPCTNFMQRFRTSKGDYRIIEWTSTPDPDTGRIFGIGRDITVAQQLEQELKNTKELLQQTNHVARVGGWSFDIQKQKIHWSSVTKEIHGVSQGLEPSLSMGINFYKEGESRDKIRRAVELGISDGTPWNLELQIVTMQGKEIWVRALGKAEMVDGKCRRLFGTFQDIDDYKRNELALQRSLGKQDVLNQVLIGQIKVIKDRDKTIEKIKEFKFLADSIPQIVWTTKANGSVDYFNEHWYKFTGKTQEQSMDAGWLSVLHPNDLERCADVWNEAVSTGMPYEVEYRFKNADDVTYKWFLGRGLPMKNEQGEIIKWFGSCTDIDEYKRALELENKISQYEEFNRIVAHNLRGPAGSIQTLLGMINNDDTDADDRTDMLAMMEQSSTSLNDTLGQLMKVLEVRNHQYLPYDDCNITALITDVESMLKGQMFAKKATVTTDLQCDVIRFPKIYLESIFYNMISNALKYSKADVPPVITISTRIAADKIQVSFKDNGLGIDLKRHGNDMFKLNKIFHTGFDSKGVGLFMTKTQIETFGGSIRVHSEVNVGTEFVVTL